MKINKGHLVKIWVLRIILILLILFWMTTIFGFSAENGEQSQSLSDQITAKVIRIIKPDYDSLSTEDRQQFFESTSFFVRKTGHFGEYGILGFLISGLLVTFETIRSVRKGRIFTACITTGLCMVYAMTDEFHQSFVAGRSPKVMDVFIDTAGGLTAALVLVLIWFIVDKRKKQGQKKN